MTALSLYLVITGSILTAHIIGLGIKYIMVLYYTKKINRSYEDINEFLESLQSRTKDSSDSHLH